jgi:small subunit ribosomal protein S2
MLSFLKRIFGAKPAESTAAPYKVEGTDHFPFPKTVKEEKKPAAKKPAAKKPAVKKPAAKKAPKKSKE